MKRALGLRLQRGNSKDFEENEEFKEYDERGQSILEFVVLVDFLEILF